MSVILRYIEVCQQVGPDTTAHSISVESNYVFKKLQMQDLHFTPVISPSATGTKCGTACESLQHMTSKWPSLICLTIFVKLQRNKLLSQLLVFPVKTCLPSTRSVYSEMCHIKGPTGMKRRHCRGVGGKRRLQFECL